ncbi:hypothetical protein M405DRAFT_808148 [Rhizopogon salebrosus TDB-379]|nr:hypothetical protein M405DRAFT_808148 [Rhizopogon salebrosus TDB-379]
MAHPLWSLPWLSVSSSLWFPLWFQAGRPPGLLALLPSTLTTQSALVLYFHFYLHLPF